MYAWNNEGIKIFQDVSAKYRDNTITVHGNGLCERMQGTAIIPFAFEATALQNGWYIRINTNSGKSGGFQGSTFNMMLEVATAARRIL